MSATNHIRMLGESCDKREVQVCYLVAKALGREGRDPFDPAAFRERLAAERARVESLSAGELDQAVTDDYRRLRYVGAPWRWSVVELARCSVWKHMGGRLWATGPVPRVAEAFRSQGKPDDQMHAMVTVPHLTFAELPLIVFRRKSSADQFRIDDGCHRAVAYYLAGFRQAFAYVGEYHGRGALDWRWEGEP
jgi:hypothetical protein